jgi:S1-C subfamily serine protease
MTVRRRARARMAAIMVCGLTAVGGCTGDDGVITTTSTTTTTTSAPTTTAVPPSTTVATTAAPDVLDVTLYDVSELVKKVRPGVVTVTQTQITIGFFGGTSEQEAGTGTGIVIDDEGRILTNFHVIAGAERVFVIAEDGEPRPARVIGGFAGSDLAVIETDETGGLEALPLGSSELAEVGDPVIAIGNALGLDESQPTVSVGIVSAKGRTLSTNTGVQLEGLLQTDAAINSGNSGGPLLNARGEVIGVNTAIIATAQNIGFSIPIEQATDLIEATLSGIGRPFIGVNYSPNSGEFADRFGLATDEGVIVYGVLPTSPADEAGLRVGDVIVQIDDVEIEGDVSFDGLIAGFEIGSVHEVIFVRGSRVFSTSVTIADR